MALWAWPRPTAKGQQASQQPASQSDQEPRAGLAEATGRANFIISHLIPTRRPHSWPIAPISPSALSSRPLALSLHSPFSTLHSALFILQPAGGLPARCRLLPFLLLVIRAAEKFIYLFLPRASPSTLPFCSRRNFHTQTHAHTARPSARLCKASQTANQTANQTASQTASQMAPLRAAGRQPCDLSSRPPDGATRPPNSVSRPLSVAAAPLPPPAYSALARLHSHETTHTHTRTHEHTNGPGD